MSSVKVVPVNDRAGIDAFIEAGKRAQSVNPHWVEPVHEEIRMAFNPRRTPFMRQNTIQPFVAFRNEIPVGRIVATIDRAHLAKHQDSCGFFGFIDAVDDRDVFAALFDAAEEFLRNHGMQRIRGPFSLTINHESGLLIHGFDEPHVVRTNHAPAHYSRHIEALGYKKAVDLLAFVCRVADSTYPERVAKLSLRPTAPKIEMHGLSVRNWSRDFPRLLSLYNDAWSENTWSTPVGREEAEYIARFTLPVSKPGWMRIARYNGEDIAAGVLVPDVNEALRGLEGKLLPFGIAKLLWRIHVRGTRMARVPIVGVAKKWRGTKAAMFAVGRLFARTIEDARNSGVEEIEYSWILEHNHLTLNIVRSLPARHTRTFRVYEREIASR